MPIGNLIACMFISNEKEMNNKHSAGEAAVENNHKNKWNEANHQDCK